VGKDSPLRALDAPLLARILSAVELVVPDMVDTLAEAISQARPGVCQCHFLQLSEKSCFDKPQ
jgi:hypothetical protein